MKRHLIFCFIAFCAHFASAQISRISGQQYLLLVGVRTDAVLWNEYGFMYFGDKHLSFQLKGSYVKNYTSTDNQEIWTPYAGNRGSVDFVSSFYYLKPSYVLHQKSNDFYTFFVLVNGMFSSSKNHLIVSLFDPVLGNVVDVTTEIYYYKSIEFEANWHINLGKQMAVSLGVLVGSVFNSPLIFSNVYNGAFSKRDTYTPGVGYNGDAYLKLNLGLVLRPY
ncbi:MAG: hypothetical protein SGJ00_10350 [bacterium]|nr:hypothetical protein [bacterium]